ncbi:MAG: tetratricopeptide repeat protein [Rickettsiales bacterium]|nr:tetratricopeptide repeat protein [Rickettsiales bacterium]
MIADFFKCNFFGNLFSGKIFGDIFFSDNFFKYRSFLLFFVFILAADISHADQSYVDNPQLVQEIEKTLLFDKDSRQQIDFYKPKKNQKKSDIVIDRGDKSFNAESSVKIIVVDPKTSDSEIREKEKLAYNSALIGQYEVAIELYKQVLNAEPDNYYAKFSLAVVYQKLGQYRQAKTAYYQLLKADVDNKEEIIGNLLAILVDESPKDALYLLSRLTIENPKSSYILAQAALAYDKAKNYDQAIILLKKAIIYDDKRPDYKYNLAVIYDKIADYSSALSLYSEVLKNSDGSDQSIPVDQIKKRIEFIRKK